MNLCECGCGGAVRVNTRGKPNRFVHGHNTRVTGSPMKRPEVAVKAAASLKRYHATPEGQDALIRFTTAGNARQTELRATDPVWSAQDQERLRRTREASQTSDARAKRSIAMKRWASTPDGRAQIGRITTLSVERLDELRETDPEWRERELAHLEEMRQKWRGTPWHVREAANIKIGQAMRGVATANARLVAALDMSDG